MSRIEKFNALASDTYSSKYFKKLLKSEIEWCRNFTSDNDKLDKNDWTRKVNRLFIDGPKPRNHPIMVMLLLFVK